MEKSLNSRYTKIKTLGEGGMGIVYKAFDNKLQRHVALKVLINSQKNMTIESKVMSKLEHPNIVRLYEYNEHPVCYIAMEYIKGITLKQYIISAEMNEKKIIDMIIRICKGVSYRQLGHKKKQTSIFPYLKNISKEIFVQKLSF
ncbi:protein kinase [Candidatus Uabimicrobium sp. HlEnr_7]|uniref:protein kinase domain-containing protein n=1 Tax=Candidatus Uabimicrobium helgolandensis TaxID=3095367 RepID=UPI003555DE93